MHFSEIVFNNVREVAFCVINKRPMKIPKQYVILNTFLTRSLHLLYLSDSWVKRKHSADVNTTHLRGYLISPSLSLLIYKMGFSLSTCEVVLRIKQEGTSLVVQWLRLHAPSAGSLGSIPGWGTKISHATQHGQIKINK